MSKPCGGCGDSTDLVFGKGGSSAPACSSNCYGLWMERNRIFPDVSFSLPATNCVVCGVVVIDVGLVPLCIGACASEWAKQRPPLNELDRKIADTLAKAIEENLKSMLNDGERPTMEQVVKATKMALDGTVSI